MDMKNEYPDVGGPPHSLKSLVSPTPSTFAQLARFELT